MFEIGTYMQSSKLFDRNLLKKFYSALYYLIAVVLLFTGATKIVDPLPLLETLKIIPIVPEDLVVPVATLLPVLEVGLGLLMLLKIKLNVILPLVVMLFFIFFAFSIYGNFVGLNADCGCFGNVVKSEFGWGMIVRNCVLFVGSVYINFNIRSCKTNN